MSFIKLSDCSGNIEAVAFSKIYESYRDVLVANNVIAMKGKVTERNGEKSLSIEAVKAI